METEPNILDISDDKMKLFNEMLNMIITKHPEIKPYAETLEHSNKERRRAFLNKQRQRREQNGN